jgi:hypothetical protein
MGHQLGMRRNEQPILKSCPEFCWGHNDQSLSLGDRVQLNTRFEALPTLVDGVVDNVGTEQRFNVRPLFVQPFAVLKTHFEVCEDHWNPASGGRPEEKLDRRPEVCLRADVPEARRPSRGTRRLPPRSRITLTESSKKPGLTCSMLRREAILEAAKAESSKSSAYPSPTPSRIRAKSNEMSGIVSH